jgi:hypothetical protein
MVEAKGVAPGMGLAHVVVLLLNLPESPEFVRFPDWSYLEHGSSFLAIRDEDIISYFAAFVNGGR